MINVEFIHNYFIKFKKAVPKKIRSYFIEIILISASILITLYSFIPQSKKEVKGISDNGVAREIQKNPINQDEDSESIKKSEDLEAIFIDVSGAVIYPGVYSATPGARLSDMIEDAGGLSDEADKLFVARNFNMARKVGDQDKIYIPYKWDISLGNFTEEKTRILEYLQPFTGEVKNNQTVYSQKTEESNQDGFSISINSASKEELETLPGVGPVTAQKIIDARPYEKIEEVVSKKALSQSNFDKIKEDISL